MTNVLKFTATPEYQDFKKMMLQEFLTKPLDIKSTTTAGIALEVRASQIAIDKLIRGFKRFESQIIPELGEKKSWK